MRIKNSFSIKQWSEHDRPREKMLAKGKEALSDAELLAIIIGSGSKDESAVGLSKRMLAANNQSLNDLAKKTIHELMKFKGIGAAKAIAIVATLELGRRKQRDVSGSSLKITSSQSVFDCMQSLLGGLDHEEFWILYLNNANTLLQKFQLSKGGITGTLVDIRLIFKKALELSAVGVILVHNHPSGTLSPSRADKTITNKIKKAGDSLDIKILDHVIITEKACFSFADASIL